MDAFKPTVQFDRPVAYAPWPPLIEARIQADQWNVTTKTRAQLSSLILSDNVTLILICMATYPVFWYKSERMDGRRTDKHATDGGMRDNQQQRTCNPAFDGDTEMCANASADFLDEDTVPVLEDKAVIILKNVTRDIDGRFYVCKGKLGEESLKTSVTMYFQRPEQDDSNTHILQLGFSDIALTSEELENYMFEFVYTPGPSPFYSNESRFSCGQYEQDDIQDGILLSTELFPNRTEIKLSYPYFKCYALTEQIRYYFTVGDSYTETIVITMLNPTNIMRSSIYKMQEGTDTILLPSDTLLTVRFMTLSPLSFIRMGMLVHELTSIGANTNEGWNPCASTTTSPKRCGIISAAVMPISSGRAIEMIMKPIRPCVIRFVAHGMQNTANGEDSESVQPTPLKDVFVLVSEARYSGFSFDPIRITSPNNDIKCQINEHKNQDNDDIVCSIEVYEGESLLLSCTGPTCQGPSVFAWYETYHPDGFGVRTSNLLGFSSETGKRYGAVMNASIVSECTVRHQIIFPRIAKVAESTYKCAFYFEAPLRMPPLAKSITIIVKVPIAPRFVDHLDNTTQPVWIHRNSTSSPLVCAVTGLPEPIVSWYILDDNAAWMLTNATGQSFEARPHKTYKCVARNFNGSVARTFPVEFERDDSPGSHGSQNFLLVSLLVVAAILIPIILFIWRWKSKRNDKRFEELAQEIKQTFCALDDDLVDKSCPLNVQAHMLSYNPKFEIDRSAFSMKSKLLGTGEFGMIYRGVLTGWRASEYFNVYRANTVVAIKIPKDLSDPRHHRALVDELKIMCRISLHVNVVLLFGACTSDVEKRQLFVLTEYCKHGSLRDYLIENRKVFENFDDIDNTVQIFLGFAYQAANGMEHLAGENIIHRDLALRNLLLTETHIVKIADFGMSRRHESVYRKSATSDVPIPVFWMALESLISNQYTQKSDVWSFGIVLWEMFSCGRRPYPDHDPDATFRAWLRASEQNRSGPPRIVCEEIYDLMRKCWTENPDPRPTFSQCKRQIGQTLETRSRSMYVSVIQDLADAWRNIPPEILARANTVRRLPANDEQLQEDCQLREDPVGDSEATAIQIQQMRGSKAVTVDEGETEGQPSDYVTTLDMDSGIASSLENGTCHGGD